MAREKLKHPAIRSACRRTRQLAGRYIPRRFEGIIISTRSRREFPKNRSLDFTFCTWIVFYRYNMPVASSRDHNSYSISTFVTSTLRSSLPSYILSMRPSPKLLAAPRKNSRWALNTRLANSFVARSASVVGNSSDCDGRSMEYFGITSLTKRRNSFEESSGNNWPNTTWELSSSGAFLVVTPKLGSKSSVLCVSNPFP